MSRLRWAPWIANAQRVEHDLRPSLAEQSAPDPVANMPSPLEQTDDAATPALSSEVARLSREMVELRSKVALILNLERYRDVILARHISTPLVLSKHLRIDARDLLEASDGVHALEYDHASNPFRWTGPGHFTRVRFHMDRSASIEVALKVASFGRSQPSDAFSFDIDGEVYPLRFNEAGRELVAGPIPPAPGMTGPFEGFIHVPTVFSLYGSSNPDRRSLGIAISAIEIRSLD